MPDRKASRWILLLHTLRFLKPRQITYQLYYKLFKKRIRSLASLPVEHMTVRARPNSLLGQSAFSAAYRGQASSGSLAFCFLNETDQLNNPSDWNNPQKPKLWLYNLHYLDDLNSHESLSGELSFTWLIEQWITENPCMQGIGWEPYPLSLRLVNLVKWFSRQEQIRDAWLQNLAQQARALSAQIEYHILANHLFANGKALVFAGAYLDGPVTDQWLNKGLNILDEQIPEQFLDDGGHFERSPMYHSTLLWDLCDLVNLAQASQLPALLKRETGWRVRIVKGLKWLTAMTHPDGQISFFNDATFGIAPTLEQLRSYAMAMNLDSFTEEEDDASSLTLIWLEPSGYAVVEHKEAMKAILDLAPVGPDYQPGHAHADTLSFELSLYGQRIFVNSGISQYGEDTERHRQRSTSAHTTVEIDGENSTEVWAGFRVARRAYPQKLSLDRKEDSILVQGAHNGYCRLPGKVFHSRSWHFSKGSLEIRDHLNGQFDRALARFYCHPSIGLQELEPGLFEVRLPSGKVVQLAFEQAKSVTLEKSTWHPEFGKATPNFCLVAEMKQQPLVTRLFW